MSNWRYRLRRHVRGVGSLVTLGLLALALAPRPVTACTIDNIPSAVASGRTAVLFAGAPGTVDPAHYAPFMIPGVFGTGWTIHFGERAQGLTLTAGQRRAPWHWDFGDGHAADGHSVTHVYRTPNTYVVSVAAVVPHQKTLFLFDRVLVHVLAPNRILALAGQYLHDAALPLLQRETAQGIGQLPLASQTLAQIENSAWASIRDYWQHTRGGLPAAYAHIAGLLQQDEAAVAALKPQQAAAIANELVVAWTSIASGHATNAQPGANQQPTRVAWPLLGGGALALLLAIMGGYMWHGRRAVRRTT